MVKVEGTLEEMYELFGDARQMVKDTKRAVRSTKKVASKVKRPLNAWQKFVKTKSSSYKYKTGAKKGQINLKAMSRDFKKTRRNKK
jgi:hypothetical protein